MESRAFGLPRHLASNAVVSVIAVLLGVAGQKQDESASPPTFRAAVNAIEIDAHVTDRDGRFIRDLTKDDFEVIEDGRQQNLTFVSLVDLPVTGPINEETALANAPAEISTNIEPPARIYVIVLDSPSTRQPPPNVDGGAYTLLTRRLMRQFVDQAIGPRDLVAVVHAQGTFSDSQPFTSDKKLILDSVNRYGLGMSGDAGSQNKLQIEQQVTRQLNTYRTLKDIAERLGKIVGRRKTVIWAGAQMMFAYPDSVTFPAVCAGRGQSVECRTLRAGYVNVMTAHQDAIRAATRNNVAIYTIDPVGLTTEMGAPEVDRRIALQAVAEDTGGQAIVGTNDFASGFAAIVRDNSSYYILGYVPEREHRDGKFHEVQVRVKLPGVSVRARKGYLAETPENRGEPADRSRSADIHATMRDLLKAPISVGGLELHLSTASFSVDKSNRSVVLTGRVRGPVQLAPRAQLALGYQVFSKDGRVKAGEFKNMALDLGAASLARARDGGLHFVERVTISPGSYELRLAANQPQGSSGSIVTSIQVPEFNEPLAVSGVILATTSSSKQLMVLNDKALSAMLGAPPTSVRSFTNNETLTSYVEVYPSGRSISRSSVSVRVEIVAQQGQTVRATKATPVLEPSGRSTGLPFVARVELDSLARGKYVLEVQAEAAVGDVRSSKRTVPFEITD